jgi:hypothetical protein
MGRNALRDMDADAGDDTADERDNEQPAEPVPGDTKSKE